MFTNNLRKIVDKRKKRLGRGPGSGKGMHTVGRGQKGQASRSGYKKRLGFEGGQTPVHRLFPRINRLKPVRAKMTAVPIDLLLERGVYHISSESIRLICKDKHTILVGPKDASKYDFSKVHVESGIKITQSLQRKIIDSGGKIG
ncbi:MAG: 50S ribosomal protein L15 [Candidatus Dojkabacteria bacterium]|nr:MAG: 50S ribosomal protein L15 [Candidatus Dojkabacteria bacterium]